MIIINIKGLILSIFAQTKALAKTYPMVRLKPLITVFITLFSLPVVSQTKALYNYQDLSHLYYQKQKDSLLKAWVCPSLYKDKTTQKKYLSVNGRMYYDNGEVIHLVAYDAPNP